MSEARQMNAWRASVYELFAREDASAAGRRVRAALILLIALSVIAAILESVPQIGRAQRATGYH